MQSSSALTSPLASSRVAARRADVLLVVVAGATATTAQSVRLVAALACVHVPSTLHQVFPSSGDKAVVLRSWSCAGRHGTGCGGSATHRSFRYPCPSCPWCHSLQVGSERAGWCARARLSRPPVDCTALHFFLSCITLTAGLLDRMMHVQLYNATDVSDALVASRLTISRPSDCCAPASRPRSELGLYAYVCTASMECCWTCRTDQDLGLGCALRRPPSHPAVPRSATSALLHPAPCHVNCSRPDVDMLQSLGVQTVLFGSTTNARGPCARVGLAARHVLGAVLRVLPWSCKADHAKQRTAVWRSLFECFWSELCSTPCLRGTVQDGSEMHHAATCVAPPWRPPVSHPSFHDIPTCVGSPV